MTATMVGPDDAMALVHDDHERDAPTRATRTELDVLNSLLHDLRDDLAAQRRMLDALDARREQLDDLIADAMPIANAALLMVTRTASALDDRRRSLATVPTEMRAALHAPPPGLLALLWRLRDREVRKAVALAIEALRVVGRVAEREWAAPAMARASEPTTHTSGRSER